MAIDRQNSDAIARHRKKNRRAARTEAADAAFASFRSAFYRRSSGRFTHCDLDDRKSSIMTAVSACSFNVDIWSIPGAISNGLGRRASGESLLRRADSQGTMWAMDVVPTRKVIQPALNGRGAHSQAHEPLPMLETFKKSLHSAIQVGCSDPRANMAHALPPHRFSEPLSELAAVVSDDEFRLAMPAGGVFHQRRHVAGAWRLPINLQRQNLAGKSIQNSRDEKSEPQDPDLCDIRMPNMVGLLWSQQALRLDADRSLNDGSWFLRSEMLSESASSGTIHHVPCAGSPPLPKNFSPAQRSGSTPVARLPSPVCGVAVPCNLCKEFIPMTIGMDCSPFSVRKISVICGSLRRSPAAAAARSLIRVIREICGLFRRSPRPLICVIC